jgi:AraC family transcriptional regulator
VGTRKIGEAITSHLSIELVRYIVSVNEPTERGGLATWRLRVIDERIAEPREPLTLAELAELCRMSVRQLTRGFRTSWGCSVTDHLGQVRIDTAKRRLASSEESIATIATSLGYASQSSFTFAFRRAMGIAPNEYRKRSGRARALAERRLK